MDDAGDLAAELEEKDKQLRRAAELGQSLLQRTEALQAMNRDLENERDGATDAIEEHEYRIVELTADASRLKQIVRIKEVHLAEMQREAAEMDSRGGAEILSLAADSAGSSAAAGPADDCEPQLHARLLLEEEIKRLKAEASATGAEEGALLAAAELERTGRRRAERRHQQLLDQLQVATAENRRQAAATEQLQQAKRTVEAAASAQRERELELETRLAALQAQLDHPLTLQPAEGLGLEGLRPPPQQVSAAPVPGPRSPPPDHKADAGKIVLLLREQALASRITLDESANLTAVAEALAGSGGGATAAKCKNLLSTARLCAMRARRRVVTIEDLQQAAAKMDLVRPYQKAVHLFNCLQLPFTAVHCPPLPPRPVTDGHCVPVSAAVRAAAVLS